MPVFDSTRPAPPVSPGVELHATSETLLLFDADARDAQVGVLMTVCLIGFVGLLLHDATSATSLASWLAAVAAASLLRVGAALVWRRQRAAGVVPDGAALARWRFVHAAGALATGLAWATLTLVTADTDQLALPITLVLALALGGAGSAGNGRADLLFTLPIAIGQEANLLRLAASDRGNHDGLVAIVWLALIVGLLLVRRSSASALRDSLAARVEHERRARRQTALIESAPLGIVVFHNTRITVVNDALVRLLGYTSKDQLVGRSVRQLLPDDAAWRESMQNAQDAMQGPVAPRIVRRKRADGTVVETMIKVAAIPLADGETEFIGIYEDVHERLVAEEYRRVLEMHRLVFESAGEGIAVVTGGVIERANHALADLLGLPVAQVEGRPLQSIFQAPDEWAEIARHFDRFGSALKVERSIVRSDGRVTWVSVTGRRVGGQDGGHDGAIVAGSREPSSIWVLADLSIQKQKEAENWHHANHDVMTGLPNRRFLSDRLDQAIASARRDGRRVAVVGLDLDGFKAINDRFGHHFGDAVLEEVARRLATVVRELDTVGRWGGDEFVLVLREIDTPEVVEETVKRVIARLAEPIAVEGRDLSIGSSIGIALFPDHGLDVESLVLAADLAMYESKGAGGNAWRFASSADRTPRGKYRPATTTSR